ncbi:MAG: hypothetical protein AAF960_24200 [Bacteroidota bacterium]
MLFGFGGNEAQNVLALVEVLNHTYATELRTMHTTHLDFPTAYCADIAFHPTNGQLFGFDHRSQRLITLDIDQQRIDNTRYPQARRLTGNVPSIFFTAEGDLFGIGAASQMDAQDRNLYQFDLAMGEPHWLQAFGVENNQDACSCPYRIKLLNRVLRRQVASCTEITFELTVINLTNTEQQDLRLINKFPSNTTIQIISELPFSGTIVQGIGTNNLVVESIYLPIGTFSFRVTLRIESWADQRDYFSQAFLQGILLEDGQLHTESSDDPETPIPYDASFSIL